MKRVCLFTGASGVLGTAFIGRCLGSFHIAAVHYREPLAFATQHQETVDPLFPGRRGGDGENAVHAIKADLERPDAVSRIVEETLDVFGRVDLLVNAAALRHWAPVLQAGSLDRAAALFHVNTIVPLTLSAEIAKKFWVKNIDGNIALSRNIVNLSSTASVYVYPDLGQSLYAATKSALNQLTYHMASEFWDIGIRVNAVAPNTFPGRVKTEQVVAEILRLDGSEETGRIILLDEEKP